MSPFILLLALLAAAVLYDFVNGFHDGANVIATMVASQALGLRAALALAALGTLVGPLLFGVEVARTVGSEVLAPGAVSVAVAMTALTAATLWNLVTWRLGIPVSSSHALVGGLVGAGWADAGAGALQAAGLAKAGLALLVSPVAGFVAAFAAMHLLFWLLRDATPRANVGLSRGQVATAAALAVANGANDAQKTAGVVALGLLLLGFSSTFTVPAWAIALSAVSIALGTAIGGGRIARTLGSRFYRVRPIHGFAAQASSAAVMLAASLAGGPASSTQVMSLAIVGAGAAERRSKVRWALLGEIAAAWLVTIPAVALLAVPLHAAIARFTGSA